MLFFNALQGLVFQVQSAPVWHIGYRTLWYITFHNTATKLKNQLPWQTHVCGAHAKSPYRKHFHTFPHRNHRSNSMSIKMNANKYAFLLISLLFECMCGFKQDQCWNNNFHLSVRFTGQCTVVYPCTTAMLLCELHKFVCCVFPYITLSKGIDLIFTISQEKYTVHQKE